MKKRTFQAKRVFDELSKAFGPQHWWPGDSEFEVMVGAILTQNTNWQNVKKAIGNLKQAKALTPKKLHDASHRQLAEWIRPAGYFNIKATRLKNFIFFFMEMYRGSVARMKKQDGETLREQLLSVNGIGPETADSILLYALDKPFFVGDAYTRRMLTRHGWLDDQAGYDEMVDLFKVEPAFFNEYHALIVNLGKEFCKPTPRCESCPLKKLLP